MEATFDPLNGRWLLVLAAVRRALAIRQPIRASRRVGPTAHFGIIIGTAILSYAKHGKFPAPTQAAEAESQRKKRPFRPNDIAVTLFRTYSGSWDETDCKCAAPVPLGAEDKLE